MFRLIAIQKYLTRQNLSFFHKRIIHYFYNKEIFILLQIIFINTLTSGSDVHRISLFLFSW